MKTGKSAVKIVFTDEERKIINAAGQEVWNEIAYDVLSAMQEQEGECDIPRAHVLELVCDAGRLEEVIARGSSVKGPRLSPEQRQNGIKLAEKVRTADYKEVRKVLLDSFKYTRYGL